MRNGQGKEDLRVTTMGNPEAWPNAPFFRGIDNKIKFQLFGEPLRRDNLAFSRIAAIGHIQYKKLHFNIKYFIEP